MNYTYRTKPTCIQAFQMTQERRLDNRDWPEWLNEAWNKKRSEVGSLYPIDPEQTGPSMLAIHTLEGDHQVSWGDYIIRGLKGELYPCKPDIFEMKYDEGGPPLFTVVASNSGEDEITVVTNFGSNVPMDSALELMGKVVKGVLQTGMTIGKARGLSEDEALKAMGITEDE